MPTAADLSETSLAMALARLMGEPHSGWADLVVHPSEIRAAQKLASAHATGEMKVRVLASTLNGIDGWSLRSSTSEVVNKA